MNVSSFALRRASALTLTALLGALLVACSPSDGGGTTASDAAASGDTGSGSGTATVSGGAVELSAAELEFNADTIEAPAGEAWTITLVNDDSAPHNVSIYAEEGGDEVVIGDVADPGQTVEVEVPALEEGEYFFVCDIHPDMNGTVVVGG